MKPLVNIVSQIRCAPMVRTLSHSGSPSTVQQQQNEKFLDTNETPNRKSISLCVLCMALLIKTRHKLISSNMKHIFPISFVFVFVFVRQAPAQLRFIFCFCKNHNSLFVSHCTNGVRQTPATAAAQQREIRSHHLQPSVFNYSYFLSECNFLPSFRTLALLPRPFVSHWLRSATVCAWKKVRSVQCLQKFVWNAFCSCLHAQLCRCRNWVLCNAYVVSQTTIYA